MNAETAHAAPTGPSRSDIDQTLRAILRDSMAVAGLLTEMEDRLDIVIEDEDVDGEMLETYSGLLAFAEAKVVES